MAGEFNSRRESKLIQSYSLKADEHAISEGAVSENISETDENEDESANNHNQLSMATFKKMVNQMNESLTKMDFKQETLENPPDCNTKLHDLLVAFPDKARSNN